MKAGAAIGLLGGSFDPVHRAHIDLARTALRALGLDAVWLMPAGAPWQRTPLAATAEHRRAMVALAIAAEDGLALCDIELNRTGPTYTVDSLRELRDLHPHAKFTLILGTDQLANFTTWKDWAEIVDMADLAVAPRPGSAWQAPPAVVAALHARASEIRTIPMAPCDVSATHVRARLREGGAVDDLLPAGVARYIEEHHLYSNH